MNSPNLSSQAIEYILTREVEQLGKLTVLEIADFIGVSTHQLTRQFQSSPPMTLDEFIIREKIHSAVFILDKNKNEYIEILADRLGFQDVETFVRAFENYMHIHPQRYRELQRESLF